MAGCRPVGPSGSATELPAHPIDMSLAALGILRSAGVASSPRSASRVLACGPLRLVPLLVVVVCFVVLSLSGLRRASLPFRFWPSARSVPGPLSGLRPSCPQLGICRVRGPWTESMVSAHRPGGDRFPACTPQALLSCTPQASFVPSSVQHRQPPAFPDVHRPGGAPASEASRRGRLGRLRDAGIRDSVNAKSPGMSLPIATKCPRGVPATAEPGLAPWNPGS